MADAVPQPLYRQTAGRIEALIRAGTWPPGARMPPDRALTERLGVSRATIREAMIALEVRGLIETRFGYGARVARPLPPQSRADPADVGFFELIEARLLVEGLIAGLAAERITEAGTAHLRDLAEAVTAPGLSLDAIAGLDRDFHISLAAITGNAVLTGIVEDFWRFRAQFPDWAQAHNSTEPETVARYIRDEHRAIVAALAAGDATAAQERMQMHCRNYGASLLEGWPRFENDMPAPEIAARFSR